MRECLEVPVEGLVEEGLFQLVEGGELAAVDGFQALGFGRLRVGGPAQEPLTSCAAEMRRGGAMLRRRGRGKALTGGDGHWDGPLSCARSKRLVFRVRECLEVPVEGLVEEGLFQLVEGGELAAVDGFRGCKKDCVNVEL